ncbi:hypothetical protein PC121_g18930 [Phytophthora cactorum]|nr:hypothetical protein PC120_g18799 [Phytophthora cactorum]KAG3049397.1 hypothetical protein PC121_g18930 [Phytophthora cactorum]KAG4047049.1 hypothetical protein PC123_g17583 [Phytophthora cactorum]
MAQLREVQERRWETTQAMANRHEIDLLCFVDDIGILVPEVNYRMQLVPSEAVHISSSCQDFIDSSGSRPMASTRRSRRCALCQQFYGSGLVDNVSAGELLRARRMLMERSTEDAGPTSRLIRKGFDHFLADLTREWEALGQRTIPLDVCVFCAQFLPSSYTMGGDPEEEQCIQSPTNYSVRVATPSSRVATCCSSRSQMSSSLVIQHQFPPRTAGRIHRPRSCSQPGPNASVSPRPTPTYRLLSNDVTRVLRIESPAAALNSMGHQYNQHRRLLTANDDVMRNLREREKQQTAAILRAESSRREAYNRQRTSIAKQNARGGSKCMTAGSIDPESPPHQNIIDALTHGAGTLYTGVVVAYPSAPAPRTSVTAKGSKIVTKKHGRHLKTELFFPTIPVNSRATKK